MILFLTLLPTAARARWNQWLGRDFWQPHKRIETFND